MSDTNTTAYGLFALRLSLFVFMAMWALRKIINPASYGASDDGAGIFGNYYSFEVSQTLVLGIGVVQIAFLIAFVLGVAKLITTGGVLLMNLTTLAVALPNITTALTGGGNILLASSIVIFGASLALFLMREQDAFLSYSGDQKATT